MLIMNEQIENLRMKKEIILKSTEQKFYNWKIYLK